MNSSRAKRLSVLFHQIPGPFTSLCFKNIRRWNAQRRIFIFCVALWQTSCLDFFTSRRSYAQHCLWVVTYLWAVSKYFYSLDNCRFHGAEGRNVYLGRDSCTATLRLEGNDIEITGMPQRCWVADVSHMQMSRKGKVVGIFTKKLFAFSYSVLKR